MAIPVITVFPQSITAGDTVRLQLSFPSLPASQYTGTLILNQPGRPIVSVTGTASGDTYLFTITSAQTTAMVPGHWTWQARATGGGDTTTALAGDFTVLPNYASVLTKSIARQQLDAANAALLILAGNPDARTDFNGQEVTSVDIPKMIATVRNLKAIVAEEDNDAAGLRGDSKTRSARPYFV